MKSMRFAILMTFALLAPATSALAEAVARQDDSSLLVWAFWAMCALIVVLQLRPAALLSFRLLKELLHSEAAEGDDEALTLHRGHKG